MQATATAIPIEASSFARYLHKPTDQFATDFSHMNVIELIAEYTKKRKKVNPSYHIDADTRV